MTIRIRFLTGETMTFGEYRLDHSKRWQNVLYKIFFILAIVTLISEILIFATYMLSPEFNVPIFKYIVIRILTPSTINFLTLLLGRKLMNARIPFKRKELIVAMISVIICGDIGIFHNYYRIMLITFAIPFLTISIFASKKHLNTIARFELIPMVLSFITLYLDKSNTDKFEVLLTIFCTVIFFLFTYFLSLNLVTAQKELLNFIFDSYKKQEELLDQMKIEPLTKLYNRAAMNQKLEYIIEKSKKKDVCAAIAVFDLDFFKNVNDTYGHSCGDEVLVALSNLIKASMPANIKNCYRFGGEEFLILFENMDENKVFEKMDSLRQDFGAISFSFAPPDTHFTLSSGIAFLEPDMNESTWFDCADKLLYKAKSQGRNRIYINREIK